MKLNLSRPIVFFDLETTGLNIARDRIVEITLLKVFPDGHEDIYSYRINPEMHIPEEASAIHKITDADVADKPTFREMAKTIAGILEGADIGGFNSNKFDIPLLAEEFLRTNINVDLRKKRFIDVQNIFHKMEKRTLEAAYKFYCDKDLTDAHSATADTKATYEVLQAQLDRYPTLRNDVQMLADFSAMNKTADYMGRIIYNEAGEEIFNFGKYKGQRVTDVLKRDPGYYSWILEGDFTLDTKRVLTEIKLRSRG